MSPGAHAACACAASQYVFAPQGHFRRAADMEYGIPGCDGVIFTRLRGEMVGIAFQPLGLQDSGCCWEWGRCARFRGKISGDGPPTWSDRCYPNRTDTPCSDPGCHATGSWNPHGHCVATECLADPQCFPAPVRGPMPCTAGSSIIPRNKGLL